MVAKYKRATQEARDFRLDPYDESHAFEIGTKRWKLNRNGAVICQTLSFGKPVSMAIPARAFKGVLARAIEMEDGSTHVSLELKHHDPALCVPLLAATHMDDIAADWHAWSRLMKLPMLIAKEDGSTGSIQKMLGEVRAEKPEARRRRITGIKRRPLFLRRRKTGIVSRVKSLTAEDVTSRS